MRKIITLFFGIYCCITMYASEYGQYQITYTTNYYDQTYICWELYGITNHVSLDFYKKGTKSHSTGLTFFDKIEYNHYIVEKGIDSAYVSNEYDTYRINTLWTDPFMRSDLAYPEVYAHTILSDDIVLKPGTVNIGDCKVAMACVYYSVKSTLSIRPKSVTCSVVESDGMEKNENTLLYNHETCIQATLGFPKEVYKWEYSYKQNNKTIKGQLTNIRTTNNGATIYVKAADFMSENDFKELVESQASISIKPSGATGYYEPISVKGVNLTARPTAPVVSYISYTEPLCATEPIADRVSIHLDRPLLKDEKLTITLNSLSEGIQKKIELIEKGKSVAEVDSIPAGTWIASILKSEYTTNNGEASSYILPYEYTIEIIPPSPIVFSNLINHNPLCYGEKTGSVSVYIEGGTGTKNCILYNKKSNAIIEEVTVISDTIIFDNLPSGEYSIIATDQNGCVQELDSTIILQNPLPLQLVIITNDATIYGKNNGKVKLQVVGGVAPYTISFMEKEFAGVTDEITLSEELYPGNYIVSVVDANGCLVSEPFSIAQPDKLLAYVTQDGQVQCFGDATASLTIDSITGGIAPYQVLWESDGYFLSNMNQFGSLSEGSYNLTVTDAAGAVYTQEIQITSPSILHLTAQATPASCLGNISGSITLQAEGGSAPYAYFLNDSMSATGKFTQLSNGTYVVSVEDKNGCLTDTLVQVPVMDGEMQAPQANFLVAGQVPLHDDVHLINIMDKAAYDSIVWVYPQENVSLYELDEQTAQLIFLQEGEYLLGMHAYKGYCSSTLYKKVKAIEQASTLEAIDAYLIENFSIDQSPNSGNFTTYIELNRATDVHLCVYNATTGLVVKRQQLTGSKCYEQSFEFNVPTGEYILFITIPEWQQSRYIKFVIY